MALISASDLTRTYRAGNVKVHALRGVDFEIESGAFVAFVGPSAAARAPCST